MGGVFYNEVEETTPSLVGLSGCGSRAYSGLGEGRARGWGGELGGDPRVGITAPVLLMNEVWGCRVGRDILR